MYKSIYFDKVLSKDDSKIDEITDIDAALNLVEQYANTGFDILGRLKKEFPKDDLFMKKILTQIEEMNKEYIVQYGVKKLYTE